MNHFLTRPGPAEVVPEKGDDRSPHELSMMAVSSLLEEAELTPKPALVDRRGSGAHHDLDLPKLRRSARSLRDGFAEMAQATTVEKTPLQRACTPRDIAETVFFLCAGNSMITGQTVIVDGGLTL